MSEFLQCRICKWVKPVDGFYPQQGTECKECTKKRTKANRAAKIDHYRAFDRQRGSLPHRVAARQQYLATDAGKMAHARAHKKWGSQNPQRRAAQVAIGNAVRDGRVQPWPCLICGAKAEAHHPDYDRPLDVVWLCSPHHKQAHALVKEIA